MTIKSMFSSLAIINMTMFRSINVFFFYAKESPYRRSNRKRQRRNSTTSTTKEIKLYFKNFEKKFGSYQFAKKRTPFNSTMFNQYVTKLMHGKALVIDSESGDVDSQSQNAINVNMSKHLKNILKRANVSPNDGKQQKRVRFM